MYSTDGDFGQVRLFSLLPPSQDFPLFTLHSIGWHCCNDRYSISRPRGCTTHLLLFTVKGEGILFFRGAQYALSPGTIALIPRDTPCRYATPPGGTWEFYWLHPCGSRAQELLDLLMAENHVLLPFAPGFPYQQQMESMLALCEQQPSDFSWQLSGMISHLLHHIASLLHEQSPALSLARRAVSYLEQNSHRPVTLQEAAEALFVSTAHLIRVFKKETGRTPHQYLTEYRLMQALQLLEYGWERVESIAKKTGFSSASHLIRLFRERYGITPLQYREAFCLSSERK